MYRSDCPRGRSGAQCPHALASAQPPLGCPELRQGSRHGGGCQGRDRIGSQNTLASPSYHGVCRAFATHYPARTPTAVGFSLSPPLDPLLPSSGCPRHSQPGQGLWGGRNICVTVLTPFHLPRYSPMRHCCMLGQRDGIRMALDMGHLTACAFGDGSICVNLSWDHNLEAVLSGIYFCQMDMM